MKKYIEQIFNEGLGTILYRPLEKKILKLKNEKIRYFFLKIYKIIYFILVIIIFFIILFIKLK